MDKVVIATGNPGKAKEFQEFFAPYKIKVETLLDHPEVGDIPETGTTFVENATIKATEAAKILHLPVIADDSGLEVDALNGAPGIYSARYAGLEKDDAANRRKLLSNLAAVPEEKRQGRFICVLVVANGQGEKVAEFQGTLEGMILTNEQGNNGFGYDSLFYVPKFNQTTAEMTTEEKGKISHRGRAMQKLQKALESGELTIS